MATPSPLARPDYAKPLARQDPPRQSAAYGYIGWQNCNRDGRRVGFGAGIARAFAAAGARVLVADIDADAARAIAQEVDGFHTVTDVAINASVAQLAYDASDVFGHIDILVNNAGTTHLPAPMEEVTEAEFDRVLTVNAKSVYLTARHFVPAMKARRAGAILNIASTAGVSPRPNLNWYNASKGWMITATKAMAIELAPYGVRVNALNPVAGIRHCCPASWAAIRPNCGRNSWLPSRWAGFRHRLTLVPPQHSCVVTLPG